MTTVGSSLAKSSLMPQPTASSSSGARPSDATAPRCSCALQPCAVACSCSKKSHYMCQRTDGKAKGRAADGFRARRGRRRSHSRGWGRSLWARFGRAAPGGRQSFAFLMQYPASRSVCVCVCVRFTPDTSFLWTCCRNVTYV